MPVRVLIVDDYAPFRRVARAVVDQTDGFEVIGEVATGEAAIELADSLEPDLVLMDVHLPGVDGVEASRRLSEALASRPPVVVLLSTYDVEDLRAAFSPEAASLYLPKSELRPEALLAAWRRGATWPH